MKRTMLQILMIAVSFLLGPVNGQETCTVGDMPSASTSSALTGTLFLDIDHPAPCSGNITTWHFCYYKPGRITSSTDFIALFQIWRPIDGTIFYQRVVQTSQTESIENIPNNENFECRDVPEDVFIPIEEGDILGIYIPGFNGLRMVSDELSDENTLQFIDPGANVDSVTTSQTAQLLTGHALHLTADIAIPPDSSLPTEITPTVVGSTTAPMDGNTVSSPSPQTTPTAQTTPSTTDGIMQPAAGLSGGGVAAIIIVMLIIIGAVVAVIVIVLVLWWHKKGRHSTWNKNLKRRSANMSGYDNAVYDEAPVRANSSLANYLNSTFLATSGPSMDYEVPINTKPTKSAPLPRNKMESMYVSMDGASVEKQTLDHPDGPDFVNSFETYAASEVESERYAVQKRDRRTEGGTDSVFNIYRSFGPENEQYCQFMEETVSQSGSLPHNVVGYFDPYADPPTDEEEICENLSTKTRNIHYSEIEILGEIGSGEFAFVNKAQWNEKSGVSLTVAVKSLHSPATQEERVKFLQEAAIMGQFVHPNVVRLIGVVKTGDEISLVTEYCAKGDLCLALKQMQSTSGELPPDTPQNLLSYSQQVALAMHYLSSKGFVHRDLAARNIFVTQENICKLGDFGMSRDLANAEYYLSQGGAIPVRWTAPEAIYYSKYSTASDIWSYGCLLFEIWSVGRKPFGGLPNTEVLETIKTGYRLPPPPGCPEAVYKIMIQCWNPETKPRPAFRDILESMLKDDKELLNIPSEDSSSHEQATQLGASLEAGKGMYLPLQHTYLTKPPVNKRETIYEAIEQFSLDFMPKNTAAPLQSNGAPPVPSSPIPQTPQNFKAASNHNLDIKPPPPATPPPTSRKPLFAKQSSLSTFSQPSSPLRATPVAFSSSPSQKPHPLIASPSTNSAQEPALYTTIDDALYDDVMSGSMGNSTGNAGGDEIYDDVVGVMGNSASNNGDAIYDDIAPGNGDSNLYDMPPDSCDVDYEDI